jgi:hypothetical protein
MSGATPSATPTPAELEKQAELYHAHARAVGYCVANLLATLGVHPHKAAHSGLHLIMAAIDGMSKADRASAAGTAEEIAQIFIQFCNHLGLNDGAQQAAE